MRSMDLICGDPIADPTSTNTIAEVRAYLEGSTASFFPAVQLIALAVCDEVARLEALVDELLPWAKSGALGHKDNHDDVLALVEVNWALRPLHPAKARELLDRMNAGEFEEVQS